MPLRSECAYEPWGRAMENRIEQAEGKRWQQNVRNNIMNYAGRATAYAALQYCGTKSALL